MQRGEARQGGMTSSGPDDALVGVDQDPNVALVTKIRALPHVKEARVLRF